MYVHDEARQKLATEARTEFADAVKNSGREAILQGDLAHLEVVRAASADVERIVTEINVNSLFGTKWKTLISNATEQQNSLGQTLAAQPGVLKALEETLARDLAKQPGIAAGLSDLLSAMNAASEAEARFVATQNFSRALLTLLVKPPSTDKPVAAAGAASTDAKPDPLAPLRDVLNKPISFKTFKRTAGDGPVEEGDVKSKTVGELVGIPVEGLGLVDEKDPKKLFEQIGKLTKVNVSGTLLFQDPGIAVTIVGLAFDVSRAEEQRVKVAIENARRRIALQKTLTATLQAQNKALTELLASGGFTLLNVRAEDREMTVREIIEQLATASHRAQLAARSAPAGEVGARLKELNEAKGTLRADFVVLYRYFETSVLTEHEVQRLTNEIDFAQGQTDVRLAAINLDEREAVIGRGMEGLVAFHEGGLNKHDVNNLINVVQAIGLFTISGNLK